MNIYLIFLIATIFTILSMLLAWYSVIYYTKKNQKIFLATYFFLLLLALVGYFFTIKANVGWMISIIAIFILLLVIKQGRERIPSAPTNRLSSLGLVICLILIYCLPFYSAWSKNEIFYMDILNNNISDNLNKASSDINSTILKAGTLASQFANDPEVQIAINQKNQAQIIDLSQKFLVSNRLDFLVVASSTGTVLYRPHNPNFFGDDLTSTYPWTSPLLSNKDTHPQISGLTFDEQNLAIMVGGGNYNLDKTDKSTLIIAGFNLGQSYLDQLTNNQKQNFAIFDQGGVMANSSLNNSLVNLFNSADFQNILQKKEFIQDWQVQKLSLNSSIYYAGFAWLPTISQTHKIGLTILTDGK